MPEKLRAILDTNSYGELVERDDKRLVEQLTHPDKIIIYGFSVIRKELRACPPNIQFQKRQLRSLLLEAYDTIVKEHILVFSDKVIALAEEYVNEYKGGISRRKMWNDFLIVAIASYYQLDIIVSEDEGSMHSSPAMRAYSTVNAKNKLQMPKFIPFAKLKELI